MLAQVHIPGHVFHVLILLSIEPDAMRFPVGSNLAAKISPECPDSSITGAWSALVLGACTSVSVNHLFQPNRSRTPWTSALLDALIRASAPVEDRTFCLFTRLWLEPGSSSAGRFSADMAGSSSGRAVYANKIAGRAASE